MKIQFHRDIIRELEIAYNQVLSLPEHPAKRIDLDDFEYDLFLEAVPYLVSEGLISIGRCYAGSEYHYKGILIKEVK